MVSITKSWARRLSADLFRPQLLSFFLIVSLAVPAQAAWDYISNSNFELGVDLSRGAAIGYFSDNASSGNVLNNYDNGRYIQQSYYGDADGSYWNGQPWVYNPVQGGGANLDSTLLDYSNDGSTIYARVMPRHWATGELLPEAIMEEWIDLTNDYAHIKFRMTFTGPSTSDGPRHQEMPAVFVRREMDKLHFYDGASPWTGGGLTVKTPGWPNEYNSMTEEWFAYTYSNDWGVGVYTPGTDYMTNYVFNGDPGPSGSGCAYAAPIRTYALTNGTVYEYDVYLTLGSVTEIRNTFGAINGDPPTAYNDPMAGQESYYTINEDNSLNISASHGVLINDTDPNSDPLSAIKVSEPAHGSVTLNSDGSLSYTPNANWYGTDTFIYKANDGTFDSNVAAVSFVVNPVNDAPEATADIYSVPWNGILLVSAEDGLLSNDTDVEGDDLTALAGSTFPTAHGELWLDDDGRFLYKPDANFSGQDYFQYRAFDGTVQSNVGYCFLNVGPPELPGDANRDGIVDDKDATIMAINWLRMSGVGWDNGDFNQDGKVDEKDASIMAANWGIVASSSSSVPEPSMLMLLAGMLLALRLRAPVNRYEV